jgi:hypothetical protein
MRHKKRETEKKQKLEELYEKHDRKALEMKDVIATGKPVVTEDGAANTEI